jgi:hypothetical protein
MSGTPDIDIDFADRNAAMSVLSVVPAMIERDGKKTAHPSGVYFQDAPLDPFTGLCSLDYKEADNLGYFKIDLLNQSVYQEVRDEDHLVTLLNSEPLWELLDEPGMVEQLPHIHKHYDVVQTIQPKSIEDLSVVLALVRPGKKHLIGRSRTEIDAEIWARPSDDGYYFKKAHACAYSALVVVAMNLLCERLLSE